MTDAMARSGRTARVAEVIAAMQVRYPPEHGRGVGPGRSGGRRAGRPVRRVLLAVDCVPETVAEAVEAGADLMIVHHPLLLRGVSSVATTTYKGAIVHRLIRAGIALFVAHTNADVATPGVSDALARRLGLRRHRGRWCPDARRASGPGRPAAASR